MTKQQMKQKPKKKKKAGKIILIIFLLLLVLGIVALVMSLSSKKKEEHRSVKIDEHQGDILLERDDEELDLSEENRFRGMNLKATDEVTLQDEAHMVLLVDADKYIYADENTKFSVSVAGNEEKGKIKINLEYGAAMFELENKLPAESEFEVETPNATAAVRGTTFGVYYDEENNETKVEVLDGAVEIRSDYGTQMLEVGEAIFVTGDEGSFGPKISLDELEENIESEVQDVVSEFDNIVSIMENVVAEKTPSEDAVEGHPILDDSTRREYIVVYSAAAMMFGNGEGFFIFEKGNGTSTKTMEKISAELSDNFYENYGNINISGNCVKIMYKQIPDFAMDIIKDFCVDSEDYMRSMTFETLGIDESGQSNEASAVMNGIMDYVFDFKVVESTAYDFFDGLGLIK